MSKQNLIQAGQIYQDIKDSAVATAVIAFETVALSEPDQLLDPNKTWPENLRPYFRQQPTQQQMVEMLSYLQKHGLHIERPVES